MQSAGEKLQHYIWFDNSKPFICCNLMSFNGIKFLMA